MKITVIGAGYVGLITAACFSDCGHNVTCVENSEEKLKKLLNDDLPISEPGLEQLIKSNKKLRRLKFTADITVALKDTKAVFISVGTPVDKSNGSADITNVLEVVKEVARSINHYVIFVTKSTVPVGTNRSLKKLIQENNPKLDFDIVSNPEFLRQGSAVRDFVKPDRIVIGSENQKARMQMLEIYEAWDKLNIPILNTSLESAELIKYAGNAFLATKISFINEISALCEQAGADIGTVKKGIGLDSRIGQGFLNPGPGYGGSCFPKDTAALVYMGEQYKAPQRITKASIITNDSTKQRMVNKILDLCDGSVLEKIITVFGVTFKPNTDDLREAPSLTIIPALTDSGARIRIVDPLGQKNGSLLFADANWYTDVYGAAEESDCIVVLTEWKDFKNINLNRIASVMRNRNIADLRNIYSKEELMFAGFDRISQVGSR